LERIEVQTTTPQDRGLDNEERQQHGVNDDARVGETCSEKSSSMRIEHSDISDVADLGVPVESHHVRSRPKIQLLQILANK
jgi:hypothetical protein